MSGKRDIAWKHVTQDEGALVCNFCGKVMKIGINQVKYHLACIPSRDIEICPRVPLEVKQQMNAMLESFFERKEEKAAIKSAKGQGFSSQPPTPGGPASTVGLRVRHIGAGQGSQQPPSPSSFFVPRNVPGSQPTLHATRWNKEMHAEATKAVASFFYSCNIPFHAADSPAFDAMVNALTTVGAGYKPPTAHDLRGSLLDNAVKDVEILVDDQKKIWQKKGCTILSDSWEDQRGRTLINFLVQSAGGIVFLRSVDASNKVKNRGTLFQMLESVVLEVRPENVVQVITDNATAYVAVGRDLEERFPTLCWTPCATHCIDLILEDIGKISWVSECVGNAKKITRFIYNHSWILALLRQHTDGRDIVRPGVTRFATNFLNLQSLHSRKAGVKRMFISDEWHQSDWSQRVEGEVCANIVFDDGFWKTASEIIQISEPLVRVLKIVEGEKKSPMGYLYEALEKAKESIKLYYRNVATKYQPFWDLIDQRWDGQLHRPIHAAAHYLNPKYYFAASSNFESDNEIMSGLYMCLERMVAHEQDKVMQIQRELTTYKTADGYLFSSIACTSSRETEIPAVWWESFGSKCPLLQQLAIRILTQPCSASGCERNWSVFEQIHTRKRNRLLKERLDKLVFVNYNLRLRHKRIEGTDGDPIDLDNIDQPNEWISHSGHTDIFDGDGLERLEEMHKDELLAAEEAKAAGGIIGTESQEQPLSPSTSRPYGTRAASKGKKRAHH